MRRYRCTQCRSITSVLPRGVLGRYLYSVGAIVAALFLVTATPVGDGLTHEKAYLKQGQKRATSWTDAAPYRWRSLDRWSAKTEQWWPDRALCGVRPLLVTFLSQAGSHERPAALEASISAHVRWGATM